MHALLALLVGHVGCGMAVRAVRLETGQGAPATHAPQRNTRQVVLSKSEFQQSVARLARDVRPVGAPLEFGRRLMFDSPMGRGTAPRLSSLHLLDSSRPQLPAGNPQLQPGLQLSGQVADDITLGYGQWCRRTRNLEDCLSLLQYGASLTREGRYSFALALAMGSVWEETREALKQSADPVALEAMLLGAMAFYLLLWGAPERFSKGVAGLLTVCLVGYIGLDTVWTLWRGWRRLVEEVDRATTFAELWAASDGFAKVVGQNAARAFIMLAMAALGNAAGLAARVSTLPGATQAAAVADAGLGVRLSALAEVHSVSVPAEGFIAIGLAPTAVAMSAGSGGNGGPRLSTRYGPPHTQQNPPHNEAIEEELARREAVGHTDLKKNKAQVNAKGERVRDDEPVQGVRSRRPDVASLRPDGVRHNLNYVSNPKNMKEELDAFEAMVRADKWAIHELFMPDGTLVRRYVPPGVSYP